MAFRRADRRAVPSPRAPRPTCRELLGRLMLVAIWLVAEALILLDRLAGAGTTPGAYEGARQWT